MPRRCCRFANAAWLSSVERTRCEPTAWPTCHSGRFLVVMTGRHLDSAPVAGHGRIISFARSTLMPGRALLLASALVATLVTLPAGTAGAASWLEMNFYLSGPRYDGVLPPCDAQEALSKIASRFNQKESQYWNTDLKIVGFE